MDVVAVIGSRLLAVVMLVCAHACWSAPTVVVLGDSVSAGYGLTQSSGWVSLLQEKIRAANLPHLVVNASISGDTTLNGLQRLPRVLAEHQPSVVIVELGGNDGLRGLSLTQMRENLVNIVRTAQNAGAQVVLAAMQLPRNFGPAYNTAFEQTYSAVAQQFNTVLVPALFEGFAADVNAFQSDGIHPNADSQEKILENVWPVLQPLLTTTAGTSEEPSAK